MMQYWYIPLLALITGCVSVEKDSLEERTSSPITVGLLTSSYTANGPHLVAKPYGWKGQLNPLNILMREKVPTLIYHHSLSGITNTPIPNKAATLGYEGPFLDGTSVDALKRCDVIVLPGIYNITSNVVDALEAYVWQGGGIITLDGAGIVSCTAPEKFMALQDMNSLKWSWAGSKDETGIVQVKTPLTENIDFSIPFDWVYNKGKYEFGENGYKFDQHYESQILMRFAKAGSRQGSQGHVALRISTYGDGRVVHLGWSPGFAQDEAGKRDWILLHRLLKWSAGRNWTHIRPFPVNSFHRYGHPEQVAQWIMLKSQEASRLVQQLGSESHHNRVRAQDKLKEMGPKAIPALLKGAKSKDPEIGVSAQKLLQHLRPATNE